VECGECRQSVKDRLGVGGGCSFKENNKNRDAEREIDHINGYICLHARAVM